jgi:hypothetical protein
MLSIRKEKKIIIVAIASATHDIKLGFLLILRGILIGHILNLLFNNYDFEFF